MRGSLRFTVYARPIERLDQASKQPAPVGGTDRRFDVVFRVRHHAEHITSVAHNAGDGVDGPVMIPVWIDDAVRRGIAKQHTTFTFQLRDRFAVRNVVAFAMRDRDSNNLTGIVAARKRCVGPLHTQVHVVTDEAQIFVAHEDSRQQAGFAQDLESIAHTEHQSALPRVCAHCIHDGTACRNGAAAQIVAVGKAPGDYDQIGTSRKLRVRVPDHRGLAA